MDKSKKLYQKIKEALAQQKLPDGFSDDIEELLEKFHIYQIELETQNEELCQAQLNLEKAHKKYADLYNNAPAGYVTLSKKGEILEHNLTALRLLTNNYIVEKDFFLYIAYEDRDILYLHLQKLWQSGTRQSCKLELVKGLYIQLESILITNVEVPVCRTTLIDITQNKYQEQQIRKLSQAIEQIPIMIMITDDKGFIEYINPVFTKITGYTLAEAVGKNPRILKSDQTPSEVYKDLWKTIVAGNIWRGQLYNRKKNGEFYWENAIISPVRSDGKIINFIAIKEDITLRKQMEEDLFKIRKLESLGVLAGGIAHDFNNLLIGILCNVSIARKKLPESAISDILEEIEQASIQAKNLTRQLLTFSKGGEAPVKQVVFIEEIIKEAVQLATSGSKIGCQYYFEQTLAVEIDVGQINQVIHNLVLNAIQAMPGGGNIEISVKNIDVPLENIFSLKAGKYVEIIVKDEGHGIAQKYLSQIFDPYFTTKQQGSGLGLFVAYSVIKNHRGFIKVESQIEHGTSFYIYLPVSRKKITAKIQKKEVIPGEGTVLLMDDDKMVREAVAAALEMVGYQVELAKDGDEAIAKYQNANKPFDVVIMDLTIKGGMGGKEAAKKLLQLAPDAKIIVSSGYSDDPVMSNFADYSFKDVVEKPYDLETLSAVLYKTIQKK